MVAVASLMILCVCLGHDIGVIKQSWCFIWPQLTSLVVKPDVVMALLTLVSLE
jgi:hypothetical protein